MKTKTTKTTVKMGKNNKTKRYCLSQSQSIPSCKEKQLLSGRGADEVKKIIPNKQSSTLKRDFDAKMKAAGNTKEVLARPKPIKSIWLNDSYYWRSEVEKIQDVLVELDYNNILYLTLTFDFNRKYKQKNLISVVNWFKKESPISSFISKLKKSKHEIVAYFACVEWFIEPPHWPHFHMLVICSSETERDKLHDSILGRWKYGEIVDNEMLKTEDRYHELILKCKNYKYGYLFKNRYGQVELPDVLKNNCSKVHRYYTSNNFFELNDNAIKQPTKTKPKPQRSRIQNRTLAQQLEDNKNKTQVFNFDPNAAVKYTYAGEVDIPYRNVRACCAGTKYGSHALRTTIKEFAKVIKHFDKKSRRRKT